ncbi:MAG TPA: hypothetical protein VGI45_13230, partial [Terracidiphilus sp.]
MFFLRSMREFPRLLAKWIGITAALMLLSFTAAGTYALGATVTVQLNAYNNDGTNTGTGRLGFNLSIVPTVSGTTNTAVTWSLSGAG